MEIANMDRRVRRTRRLLKDSLIALMQEKEFMDISVKEITDRADLNRGTFYRISIISCGTSRTRPWRIFMRC